MKQVKLVAIGTLLCALASLPARAIVAGQVDTFGNGSTEGWTSGGAHPSPPVNVASGGPAGEGDGYMRVTSVGGFGAGSRFVAFNTAQWAGDYTAAGVVTITMDVNNLGESALALRLSIADGQGQTSPNMAVTEAVSLPAGSGWTSVSFGVDPESLIVRSGSVATALTTARVVRLIHSPTPGATPEIEASLGVDNIRAVGASVPGFTVEDITLALEIAAGLHPATAQETARLDVVQAEGESVDLSDAVRIARKVAGLEPNP